MPQQVPFRPIFMQAARRFNLDPRLLMAVARQESGFNPTAKSPAGAVGVMQLMPGTAEMLGVDDPTDPVQNIVGGAAYLSRLVERFDGDIEKALAGYNWGPNRDALQQDNWKELLPEETANYVPSVMAQMDMFEDVSPDVDTSFATQFERPLDRLTPEDSPRIKPIDPESPLDTRLQEVQRDFPRAVDYLREAEKPPRLKDIGSFNRSLLKMEAEDLGVEPQQVLDRAWELTRLEAEETQQRINPETSMRLFAEATTSPGRRSSDSRRFFSDLTAARPKKKNDDRASIEDEPLLGDILPFIGGGSDEEERPPPEVQIAAHPRGRGEFPRPRANNAVSERLRRLIAQRLAKRRQRFAQRAG